MRDNNTDIHQIYDSENSNATRQAYDDWAIGYDSENIGRGYRVPGIGCALIARYVGQNKGQIYDAACGTGIVGGILELLGYKSITGSDLSPAMLKVARKVAAYKRLYEHDLGNPLPEENDIYNAVVCFGSLGPGHAPANCLDEFVRITRLGGHVVFNTRAETYAEQDLKQKVDGLSAKQRWTLVEKSPIFRSYYLVEPDVTSQVFVFQVN